jgi:hypothetical protein
MQIPTVSWKASASRNEGILSLSCLWSEPVSRCLSRISGNETRKSACDENSLKPEKLKEQGTFQPHDCKTVPISRTIKFCGTVPTGSKYCGELFFGLITCQY